MIETAINLLVWGYAISLVLTVIVILALAGCGFAYLVRWMKEKKK